MEFMELFPSTNDYLCLKEYSDYKRYFENSLSPDHIEIQKKFFNKYNKVRLPNNDISKIFKYNIEKSLDSFNYNFHLMPLNHSDSVISYFAEMASGKSLYKFKTKKDFLLFIEKSHHFTIYINQAIINMKEGIKKKVVIPKRICKLLIEQIKDTIKSKSYRYTDIPKLLDYNITIQDILEPCLKNLLKFLVHEYYPNCCENIGLVFLPNGKKMYQHLVDSYTTLNNANIDKIHNYGLSEVNRIYQEMIKIKDQYKFKGSLKEFNKMINNKSEYKFKDSKELVNFYKNMQKYIQNTVFKEKFNIKISHQYLIKEVPKFNQKFAPAAYYMPGSLDKSRKGTFYINTNNIKEMNKLEAESLVLHEGNPGHHLQLTYLLDNNFPLFLKTIDLTAYEEGWALYCEQLGEYKDPLSYYGKLNMEMERAIRLVVDTGIHYYGWSFKKCFDFFKKYSLTQNESIKSELDRYIAIPGQALAYKMGEKIFKDLKRKNTKSEKDFHNKIITKGPLPLFILKKLKIN